MLQGTGVQNQTAAITWRAEAVPVSTRFDDPYFSLEDGLAETRHVFLAGNGLPARFRDGFHVAELGFGTGLNLLATLAAWEAAEVPGTLRYTGFEAFPMRRDDMRRALSAFGDAGLRTEALLEAWRPEGGILDLGSGVRLELVIGDARRRVADWDGMADAWFLDGFSPARNPELWEPELMREVARHCVAGGTFATYSAAGHVRRDLAGAGFAVERCAGYGRKRHMTRGVLAS